MGNVLSKNEKVALYGLVRYPQLKDIEIAERIGLKISTFNAIKNRLRRRGYYSTVIIPYLQELGCELLSVSYGWTNPSIPLETKLKKIGDDILCSGVECFYQVAESNQAFSLLMGLNYTDLKINVETLERRLSKLKFLGNQAIRIIFFPFKTSKIFRFFDFAPLIAKTFELNFDEKRISTDFEEKGKRRLSQIEKRVYYGLIKYPDLSDSKIAEKMSLERHTVANIRKRFEKEKLIKKIRVPDLKKLGFQMLVFSYSRFNPLTPLDKRKKGIELLLKGYPNIMMLTSHSEAVNLFVVRDFEEYKKSKDEVISYYSSKNFFAEYPTLLTFSTSNMRILKNFEFGPIVRKVLKIQNGIIDR